MNDDFRVSVIWAVLVAMLEVVILPLALAVPAEAAHTSCSPIYIEQNGHQYTNSTYMYGGQTSIQFRQPDICSNYDAESYTYVMLANNGVDAWAQIGYQTKNYGQANRFFWQWTKCYPSCTDLYCATAPCVHTGLYQTPVSADYHLFSAQRDPSSPHYIHLTKDDVDGPDNADGVHSWTSFDPVNQTVWDQPFRTKYSEEVHWCGVDYAGTQSYKTNFTDTKQGDIFGGWAAHQIVINGGDWGQFTDDQGIGHLAIDASYPPAHFQVWTNRGSPDLTCQ
jgi:hypothetical protein